MQSRMMLADWMSIVVVEIFCNAEKAFLLSSSIVSGIAKSFVPSSRNHIIIVCIGVWSPSKTGIFHSPSKPHTLGVKSLGSSSPPRFFPLTDFLWERVFLMRELYWLEKTDSQTLFAWQNIVIKRERGQLFGIPPGWSSEISRNSVPLAFKKSTPPPSAKFSQNISPLRIQEGTHYDHIFSI